MVVLGGIMSWECWTPETQECLLTLNSRKTIQ